MASLTLSPSAHPPIVVSSSISLFRDLILSVRFMQPWFSVLPRVSEAFLLQAPTFSPIFSLLEEFLKQPLSSPLLFNSVTAPLKCSSPGTSEKGPRVQFISSHIVWFMLTRALGGACFSSLVPVGMKVTNDFSNRTLSQGHSLGLGSIW